MPDIYYTEKVKHNEYAEWGRSNMPSKSGYTFVGWKYKGVMYSPSEYAQINPFGPIREDVNISAVWREGQTGVRVTFNVARNNGVWADDNSTNNYIIQTDGNIQLTADRVAISQHPSESGFVGWSTDPTAEIGEDTFEVGENDTTVYAIFKEGETSEVIELEFNVDGEIAQFENEQQLRKSATVTKKTIKALAGRPISYQSAALKPSDNVLGYEAILQEGVSAEVDNSNKLVTATNSISLVPDTVIDPLAIKWPVTWQDPDIYVARIIFRVDGYNGIWIDGTKEDHEITVGANVPCPIDETVVFYDGEDDGYSYYMLGWECVENCRGYTYGSQLVVHTIPPNNKPIVFVPRWYSMINGYKVVCFQLDNESRWATGFDRDKDHYVSIKNGKATCDKNLTHTVEPGKKAVFKGWKCYKGCWDVTFEGLNTVVTDHTCIVRPVWEITEE